MKKKITVINCHPNPKSLNNSFAKAYLNGAQKSGAEVAEIQLASLQFEPNLKYGYQQRMELEPDLLQAWEKIKWADHLVWVHPVWWGGLPALAKGFIDRLFLPGMAFKPRENSIFWDKLLKGKTAHIITTLDQPSWYYRFVYGKPSVNQLKKTVLQFCGVQKVRVSYFGIIKTASPKKREEWISKATELGLKQK